MIRGPMLKVSSEPFFENLNYTRSARNLSPPNCALCPIDIRAQWQCIGVEYALLCYAMIAIQAMHAMQSCTMHYTIALRQMVAAVLASPPGIIRPPPARLR